MSGYLAWTMSSFPDQAVSIEVDAAEGDLGPTGRSTSLSARRLAAFTPTTSSTVLMPRRIRRLYDFSVSTWTRLNHGCFLPADLSWSKVSPNKR